MRIGFGYDVHQLTGNRKLILGGEEIPFEKGLLGHSDADVLTHALMDALLGAAGLGDIGRHFPDTDSAYAGADSIELLGRVKSMLDARGWRVGNIDCTVIAQRPKLADFIPAIRLRFCEILETEEEAVNVKATTTEHLGFAGRGEGIAACAVCTLEKGKEEPV